VSGTREKHAEVLSNRGGEVAIGYQLELEKASRCGNCAPDIEDLGAEQTGKI
jgi:hypothetical protein